MSEHPTLTTPVVTRLYSAFTSLGWHVSEENAKNNQLFNAFCSLLERLDAKEQELLLTLTEGFLHCNFDRYPSLIGTACGQIDRSILGSSPGVLVVPFTRPEDAQHTKSGHYVAYQLKETVQTFPAFSEKRLTLLHHVTDLLGSAYAKRFNTTILFVDDYIGTGETATRALDEYEKIAKRDDDTVIAVSLVALRKGFDILKGRVPNSFAARIRDRGISDSTRITDKSAAIQTMAAIEQRLNVDAGYRLGYQASEGLEKMIRTPDNTFPIYWHKGNDSNNPWPAPFLRQ